MSQGADTTEGVGGVESSEDPAGSLSEIHEAELSQEGEESGADAQESEEPTEADEVETSEAETESDEDEGTPGADSEKTEPGSEADEQQANPLMEELRSLRAEVMSLRTARQEPEPQQVPSGPDPRQVMAVKDGILRLLSSAPGEEQKALAALHPQVRDEVLNGHQRGQEAFALLGANDGAFAQVHVFPHIAPAFKALLGRLEAIEKDRKLESFALRNRPVLQDQTSLKEVFDLVEKGTPEDVAVRLVKAERELAAANKQKAKVTQKETEQRALSSSRRSQAARKPDMKGKPPAKPKGGSFKDFVEAYEPRFRAATEE